LSRSLKPGDDEDTNISKRLFWFLRKAVHPNSAAHTNEGCIEFRPGGWVSVDALANADVLAHIPRARLLSVVEKSNREKVRYELRGGGDMAFSGWPCLLPSPGYAPLEIRALRPNEPRERKAKVSETKTASPTSQQAAQQQRGCQRRMVGELLFPMVQKLQPLLAGKVTGMLLELADIELFPLLEQGSLLQDRVMEAMGVLQGHTMGGAVPSKPKAAEAGPRVYTSV